MDLNKQRRVIPEGNMEIARYDDKGIDMYTAVCTKLADINESRNQGRLASKPNTFTSGNTGASMSRTETRKREGTSTFDTVFAFRAKALESLPPRNVSCSTVGSVIIAGFLGI
jgi:hypothetical protein